MKISEKEMEILQATALGTALIKERKEFFNSILELLQEGKKEELFEKYGFPLFFFTDEEIKEFTNSKLKDILEAVAFFGCCTDSLTEREIRILSCLRSIGEETKSDIGLKISKKTKYRNKDLWKCTIEVIYESFPL